MDRVERQKLEDICEDALICVDEIIGWSPNRLTDDIIRDGSQNDLLAQKPAKIAELFTAISTQQRQLASAEESIETIYGMIQLPADGDESFVDDEIQLAKSRQRALQGTLGVVIDFAKYNDLTKNNTTLAMIAENIHAICTSIDKIVDGLNKMYDR